MWLFVLLFKYITSNIYNIIQAAIKCVLLSVVEGKVLDYRPLE